MIRLKHVTLLIAMAMVVGCSTIHTNFVAPSGRSLPNPNYTLQVIGEPLYITFYYTAFQEVKDLDGSIIAKPTYLDFLKFQDFDTSKVKVITLTIEVNNPKKLEYGLYEKVTMKTGGGNVNWTEMQTGGEVNRSNLPFRQFVYRLPYGKKIKMVDHVVIFYLNDQEVARVGHFRYQLQSRGGE